SDFFFSSRRRHTRSTRDWSSDVCSSDLEVELSREPRPGRVLPGPLASTTGKSTSGWNRKRSPRRAHSDSRARVVHASAASPWVRSEERRVGEGGGARWWA